MSNLTCDCSELLLKGHTHEFYLRDTSYKQCIIPYPSLSIAILAQLSIAAKLYSNETLKDVGLLNRLVPYFHWSLFESYIPEIRSIIEEYNWKIKLLKEKFYTQDLNKERATICIDNTAMGHIQNFQNEIFELRNKFQFMSGWLSKLAGQAIRFACDVHCWNYASDPLTSYITQDEVKIGIEIGKDIN